MMHRLIVLLFSYLLGCILTGEIISHAFAHKPASELGGSGNPGMANITSHLGIVPGLILCGAMAIYVAYISKKRNYPAGKSYTPKEFLKFTLDALPALFTPVILFAGIYGGVMTPTEAGAVAALYALIIAVFYYRSIDLKNIWKALRDTALNTGTITVMTAASVVMSYMVAKEGVSQAIAAWILGVTTNKYLLLFLIDAIFIALGMILDVSVLQYVFVPLILPVVSALGVNLVHFGVVIVLNMMIGLSTPPFGMCLFISSSLSKSKLANVSKEILPMVIVMLIVLFVLTYCPVLVTGLPTLLGY
jgi:tripartite ATP-independent transporter DctM subunit